MRLDTDNVKTIIEEIADTCAEYSACMDCPYFDKDNQCRFYSLFDCAPAEWRL